jgi:hypothetical protein
MSDRRLHALLVFVATAIVVAPIWSARFLPVLDEPNHLGALSVWYGLVHHDPSYEAFYRLSVGPYSYLLHYGLAFLLSLPFGVEVAHKLVLSAFVALIPLSAVLYCDQARRSRALALLTAPLAYSISWAHGFHPFDAGMAMCVFALVAFDRLLLEPSTRRYLLVTSAGLGCYFGHPLTLALLYVGVAALVVLHRPGVRRALSALFTLIPSFGLLVWQSRATEVPAGSMGKVLGPGFPIVDPSVWRDRLLDLPEHALNPLALEWDSRLFALTLALVAALFVVAVARRRERASDLLVTYRAPILALVFLAIYLVLPEHFNEPVYMWIARGRVATLVAFFALVSPPIPPASRLRFVASGAAVALLSIPLAMSVTYRAYGREIADMERVLSTCPAGAQVLTIRVGDQAQDGLYVPVFRQLPSLVQTMRGGYSPQFFPRPIPFPFEVTRHLPAPHWRMHERYRPYLLPAVYGCVLTHRLSARLPSATWRLAAEQGDFRLYTARR